MTDNARVEAMKAAGRQIDKLAKYRDDLRAILHAVDHTLSVHGKVDCDTPLHDRIRTALASTESPKP